MGFCMAIANEAEDRESFMTRLAEFFSQLGFPLIDAFGLVRLREAAEL
jgi:hypothetical protein